MVLHLKVPYAFKVREPVRVPWLLMCATLCYRGDLLGEKQTANQRVERYSAEYDGFTHYLSASDGKLTPRPEWCGVRPPGYSTGGTM